MPRTGIFLVGGVCAAVGDMTGSLEDGDFQTIEPCFNRILLSRTMEYNASRGGHRGVKLENKLDTLLVSVITVCYNSAETIRDTIESVLNQDYDEIEYLIIDGDSKDDTLKIARSYQERFRERGYGYKIVSERDAGLYDAMNKGIRLAGGTLIGIINSDDWYEPTAVSTAAEAYRGDAYDMFYADIRLIRQDGRSMIKHSRQDRFPTSRHWNHPTTFITKKIYEELGGYRNEGIHDDFELFLRIRRAGKKIVIKNVVLANFRSGGVSNDKSLANCRKRCRDRYRCYRNNGYSRWYLLECVAIEAAKFLIG